MLKTTIPEFKEKYPKLISKFERTTGKHAIWGNRLTYRFKHWLRQKIKYKNLICPECNREFDNKGSLTSHKIWHKKGYREKISKAQKEAQNRPEVKERKSKATIKQWQNEEYRESMTGENHPFYGKYGKESNAYKGNSNYYAIHYRVRKRKIKPENCEICGLPAFYKNLGDLELSDITGLCLDDNNNFQYIHHSCHMKYDSDNNIIHIKYLTYKK